MRRHSGPEARSALRAHDRSKAAQLQSSAPADNGGALLAISLRIRKLLALIALSDRVAARRLPDSTRDIVRRFPGPATHPSLVNSVSALAHRSR